jgi:ADP-dependent NAD(P)H-hydrate dehydratase / NAD(P)H-hydrate epimerase
MPSPWRFFAARGALRRNRIALVNPTLLTAETAAALIPERLPDAHKGTSGHLLLLAGSRGLSGAAVLAARGALRAGAGLVTAAIVASERQVITASLPEALTLSLPESPDGQLGPDAYSLLEKYRAARGIDALAMGPGLSVRPPVGDIVRSIVDDWTLPMVLDADALNSRSADDLRGCEEVVITPHPGEMARLLKRSIAEVQAQRVQVAERAAKDWSVVCVLKGHQTVVTDGTQTFINTTGNPAMASGGMGDVLTGVIGALLAQGASPLNAACAGVFLHGLAADRAAVSDRGLLASDVADALPLALKEIGFQSDG